MRSSEGQISDDMLVPQVRRYALIADPGTISSQCDPETPYPLQREGLPLTSCEDFHVSSTVVELELLFKCGSVC